MISILMAVLPWSTFGLIGVVLYLLRTNRKLGGLLDTTTGQVRDLAGQNSALRAHVAELNLRITRMHEAFEQVGRVQANAAEAARQVAAGTSTENAWGLYKGLSDDRK